MVERNRLVLGQAEENCEDTAMQEMRYTPVFVNVR